MTADKQKPTILLIAAGGTIGLVRNPQTGKSVPGWTGADLLVQTAVATTVDVRIRDWPETLEPYSSPNDLLAFARSLQQEVNNGVDGVVVTHGTDTLEEVAYFIDEVIPPAVPIVFTGAMRPTWVAGYDGIRNLENAFRVVLGVAEDYGTLVTLGDTVFEAWSVYKQNTGALDAFAARYGAPFGRILGDQVTLTWRPVPRTRLGRLPETLPTSVPILTMGIADDAIPLAHLPEPTVQGLVVAGMAAGSIPPIARERIMTLAETGLPVVLCSGAANGRTAEEYYYPGAYDDLRAAGVQIEDWLAPRKARIRLMLSLGLQEPYVPFGKEFIVGNQ